MKPKPTPGQQEESALLDTYGIVAARRPRLSQNEAEYFRMSAQMDALYAAALYKDATPEQEIAARAAVVEHSPQLCKPAQAMRLFRAFNGTYTFTTPSKGTPGKWNMTVVNRCGLITCNCTGGLKCWHRHAAENLAVWHRLVDGTTAPLIQIENLTEAAYAADEARELVGAGVDYNEYFEGN